MLRLKNTLGTKNNPLPPVDFSIGDECLLNGVRVDNANDKCFIYRFLVTSEGKLYATWQVIYMKEKKTYIWIYNSDPMIIHAIKSMLDSDEYKDEYGKPLPVSIYGSILGDNKVYNEHNFTADQIIDLFEKYDTYYFDMSFRMTASQYAKYVDGVKDRPGAAVIDPSWYVKPDEVVTLSSVGIEAEAE